MRLRLTSSALALMALASPGLADVTPDEVWSNWLRYFETAGYEISKGSRDGSNGNLTLRDVHFRSGTDEARVEFTVSEIAMESLGDGRVRTVYAAEQPIAVSGVNAEGKPFELDLSLSYPGNELITSGEAGAMTHDYAMPELALTFGTLKADGKEMPLPITLNVTGSKGRINSSDTGGGSWDYTHESDRLDFQAAITNPEEGARFNLTGGVDGLGATGAMTAATSDVNMQEDLARALKDGLEMKGTFTYGPAEYAFDFEQEQKDEDGAPTGDAPHSGKGSGSAGAGELTFALSQDGVAYQGTNGPVALDLALSSLPFPITYATESSSFDMQLPVTARDEAQPFKLAYSLAGVTLGDEVWDQFDPQGQLARDPASLDIDLSGELRVIRDMFDPEALAAASADEDGQAEGATAGDDQPESPFEPLQITISQLALQLMGASVSAEGELRPSDSGEMAEPVGRLHARYEGVNGLIQTLEQVGLVPQDQAATARMMLALFARPAEGDDVLTTDVEFREDGSIFANGQQVK